MMILHNTCYLKSDLYLCLYQVRIFLSVSFFVTKSVLCLQAASGVEPVLHTGNVVVLFEICRFIRIKIIKRSDKVEVSCETHTSCCIESFTFYVPVLAAEIFGTQIETGSGNNPSCAPTLLIPVYSESAIACPVPRINDPPTDSHSKG